MGSSFKEERIKKITQLYYSRKDVQKAIFEFSKNREISPRYFEGFGKRPDTFQYVGDVFELVKKGATSFHCSEEIWEDPLKIVTGMTEAQANELRIGWDLLIDIDCKWFDYSKLAAKSIIKMLRNNKVKNVGLKFSGSKGWHIIVPWKAFPKEVGGIKTKDLFPEFPRKIMDYIRFESEKILKENLPEDFYDKFKKVDIKRGIKCNKCNEVANAYEIVDFFCNKCQMGEQKKLEVGAEKKSKCSHCSNSFVISEPISHYECDKCGNNSKKNPNGFSRYIEEDLFELMGLDLILISPRHLFRAPYSLHEKTSFVSVVIDPEEIDGFDIKDANHVNITPDKIKNFDIECSEGEATHLCREALDWISTNKSYEPEQKISGKYADYKPIKLTNLVEQNFPPCVKKILLGVEDGKKRALFVLINLFRSVGMDKEELEKKVYDWNKKNNPPLKEGYIKSQLSWSYRKKPIMPPNCKDFYKGIGACNPDNFCSSIKNPVNYTIRKNLQANKKTSNKKTKKKE